MMHIWGTVFDLQWANMGCIIFVWWGLVSICSQCLMLRRRTWLDESAPISFLKVISACISNAPMAATAQQEPHPPCSCHRPTLGLWENMRQHETTRTVSALLFWGLSLRLRCRTPACSAVPPGQHGSQLLDVANWCQGFGPIYLASSPGGPGCRRRMTKKPPDAITMAKRRSLLPLEALSAKRNFLKKTMQYTGQCCDALCFHIAGTGTFARLTDWHWLIFEVHICEFPSSPRVPVQHILSGFLHDTVMVLSCFDFWSPGSPLAQQSSVFGFAVVCKPVNDLKLKAQSMRSIQSWRA